MVNVGKYTSPMDPMGNAGFREDFGQCWLSRGLPRIVSKMILGIVDASEILRVS